MCKNHFFYVNFLLLWPWLWQVRYTSMSYFPNIIWISTVFLHLRITSVSLADFYEIRNTATRKFAFCDNTLIVAMITLQEPYFPKLRKPCSISGICGHICTGPHSLWECSLKMLKNKLCLLASHILLSLERTYAWSSWYMRFYGSLVVFD